MNEDQQTLSTALSSLENLRTRLLDLSPRNRLLNFRHSRTGNLRIIDELPDQLHEKLLSEQEVRFLPVPEPIPKELIDAGFIQIDQLTGQEIRIKKDPTAEEWARSLGLQTSYELPEPESRGFEPEKHRDKAIQTLLFPYELETKLRDLRAKAKTAIEETGANILYLTFGFLEWFESPESDTPRLAPLVLVPVRLSKGRINRQTGTYEYTIAYSGEDILPNLSLREELRLDFGLALPDLDDNTKPEEYFSEIRKLIKHNQPRWQVRRYATAALLNFSKLLMYLDLDPKRWPEDKPITSHTIIKSFFEGRQSKDSSTHNPAVEYKIDELMNIHEQYPLIEDADSSQHSALVDAINGENLVIEGPPGTGKSQTITNLIAAALAQGKRVLFVAEKLAALEVVKRRLDNAGLGDFCLELHSHKTQKRKVLDDIESRIVKQGRYRVPAEIDTEVRQLEALKNKLREYAELINKTWKETGKSIHEILATATRYRQQLKVDPSDLHPDSIDSNKFNLESHHQIRDQVRFYGHIYTAVEKQLAKSCELASHPWYGINNADLQFFDSKRISSALRFWQEELQFLDCFLRDALPLFSDNNKVEIPQKLKEIEQLVKDFRYLSNLNGNERLDVLPWLRGDNLEAFRKHLEQFHKIQEYYRCLAKDVRKGLLEDLGLLDHLRIGIEGLEKLGVSQETDLNTLAKLIKKIDDLEHRFQEIESRIAEISSRLSSGFENIISLHEQGLKELRKFIDMTLALKPNLWKYRHERFEVEELDEVLPLLQSRITNLRERRNSLARTFLMDPLPQASELEEIKAKLADTGLLRWLKRHWRTARKRLLALASNPRGGIKPLISELNHFFNFAKDKETLEGDQQFGDLLGEHFHGIETAIDDLLEIRNWYRLIRQYYGIGFGPKVGLGQALLDMPAEVAAGLRSLAVQGFLKLLDKALEELVQLKNVFSRVVWLQRGDVPILGENNSLSALKEHLSSCLSPCQNYFLKPDLSISELQTLLTELLRLHELVTLWTASEIDTKWFGGTLGLREGLDYYDDKALAAAEQTESLAWVIDREIKTPFLKEAIYKQANKDRFETLANFGQKLKEAWSQHEKTLQEFSDPTTLDFTAWTWKSGDQIWELIERNNRALTNPDWLANWLDYVRGRQNLVEIGFGRLVKAVEGEILAADDVEAGYYLAVYDMLSREILREVPQLARFSGDAQEAIQKQFREYDEKLKQLQRERIAWCISQKEIPGGNLGDRISEYSELALLRHECSKKKRNIPIRQLVRRAGNALVALKPCLMLGPMSVAQYLAPGELEFDLVVMDEASQIKPEGALGAIARGRQLVVVGDPKQLPPTNFFQKLVDDDNDDQTLLEDSESILDALLPLFKKQPLLWHYRSRHESLIAFSNEFFYQNNLILFPSPYNESDEYGVKFTRVHTGKFVNSRNMEEARVIAEAVKKHLLERSEETLGAVAMSVEQRDQIERAVEMLAKEDQLLQYALEKDQNKVEPLFIKNLENVQGDERDVIYISMTYGPQDIGGRPMQRFGPINYDSGWRRLNVLFTRARKRMHVFSSMGSEDIVLKESSKLGAKALKDFLAYAETRILHKTRESGLEPDSDFEVAFADALRSNGFECVAQVGVAGYFIDIAVRDPGNPSRFLMGIECDGASYHSAKSVRDRDRLRQMILERLGWRIRRIWSTDWYKNPQAQLQPIIRELNVLKTEKPIITTTVELPEVVGVEAMVERIEKDNVQSLEQIAGEGTLRERLLKFDLEIVRKACPNTPENERLLRPAMLDALLEHCPTSKWEFLERIPNYLRQGTSADEGRYIAQVLEIIDDASERIVSE